MINARVHFEKASLLMGEWLASGGFAYLGLLKTVGDEGRPLGEVLSTAQLALTRGLGGKAWVSAKQRYLVAGQLSTLAVERTKSGRWRVLRWFVLGTRRELNDEEQHLLAAGIRGRAQRSGESSAASISLGELHQVFSAEVRAIAQLMTGAESPLDAPIEPFAMSLKIEFGDGMGERPADLAEHYRSSEEIRLQFEGGGELGWRHGRLGVLRDDGGFLALARDSPAHPFAEYAWGTSRVKAYTAGVSRDPDWATLLERSRRLSRADTSLPAGRSSHRPLKK